MPYCRKKYCGNERQSAYPPHYGQQMHGNGNTWPDHSVILAYWMAGGLDLYQGKYSISLYSPCLYRCFTQQGIGVSQSWRRLARGDMMLIDD
jgi:hypothetical protein